MINWCFKKFEVYNHSKIRNLKLQKYFYYKVIFILFLLQKFLLASKASLESLNGYNRDILFFKQT